MPIETACPSSLVVRPRGWSLWAVVPGVSVISVSAERVIGMHGVQWTS